MAPEKMAFDVVIVGAGPAGLSTAIRLAQLAKSSQKEVSICVLEKSSTIGGHILSGAVLEPRALNELIPDWKSLGAPIETSVTQDQFLLLTEKNSYRLPTPPQMKNHGNYIISLGKLCRWLAEQAESLGVSIFPGICADYPLMNEDGTQIHGIASGVRGADKEGNMTDRYDPGVHIESKMTILSEGCHGSVSQFVIKHFNLRKNASPQTYALGVKELWQTPKENPQDGSVIHSIGWPLDHRTYGGSFLYQFEQNKLAVGFVVGLDYQNPYIDPFQELQRFKTHPAIRQYFKGAERIGYGARALVEGGWQSIPHLQVPGCLLIGDSAGLLNVPKIKGTHTAMKSGMIAAETVFDILYSEDSEKHNQFTQKVKSSWIGSELKKVRNIRAGFQWGLWPGLLNAALETYVFQGQVPWTLKYHADHLALKSASDFTPIPYPRPDGILTFDKLSSLSLAHLTHDERQPCHLVIKDDNIPIEVNLKKYAGPEGRYCPAGVYEFVTVNNEINLQINASNCVHCKTCDIKDPIQNIRWTPPEGGSGPNYEMM